MAVQIPQGAPPTLGEAFARINSVTAPTVDDLKIMVLLEAAGLQLYAGMADQAEDPGIAESLRESGRQELAHAHRVAKAIHAISGETFDPPEAEDNPYLRGPLPAPSLTAPALRQLAEGEFAGDRLYESWAASSDNAEAARLFRLNGAEETEHGNRLLEIADRME